MCKGCGFPILVLKFSRPTSGTKMLTYFFNIYYCTFGTGYGLEHIDFTYYFNSKSTGYIFQGGNDPSNKSSIFYNKFAFNYVVLISDVIVDFL